MPKVTKPEQSIYECLLVSVLNNISRHKFWLHRDSFPPNQTKK